MNITNLFKVSFKAVANNKMRSFLSMLGIIIGVAAVIIMMAIGQGSKESIRQELSTMGTNLLTIRPGADMRGGVRQDPSAMQTLKQADYERILREKKFVSKVSPEVTASGQAIYGNNNTTTSMYGESTDYLDIKQWSVERGDCFTDEDIKKAAKVCVVGATIVKELFNGHDPIGKTIRFKSIPMRVVGVLKAKGYNSWGMDQDNVVIAPYTTVMKRIAAQTWYSSIVCSALTEELSDAAIEELTQMLRDNHKLKGEAADDFTIRSQAEMMETMSSTMDTVTRCHGTRHLAAVPYRVRAHLRHGWSHWHPRRLLGQCLSRLVRHAQQRTGMVYLRFLYGMRLHWRTIRLYSRTESRKHGSHRSYPT